jgi:hypothetical protein
MRALRFSFLSELFSLFSVALLIDYFFFQGDRFWELQLHPFFFIVILVSIQYGTNKGLIASFLSTIILLTWNIPKQSLSQDLFDFLFYISYRPMLWIALAILLGEFRDKYFLSLDSVQKKLSLMEKQAAEFCRAYELLDKERVRLEMNLTSHPSTVQFLNKIADKTKTLDHKEILNSLLDLTDLLMKPKKCSWFLFKNSNLKMVAQNGWKGKDKFLDSFSPSYELYREVVELKRVLCVTNPEDVPILMEQGVLAGPLYNKKSGKVFGMIKIEDMDFLGLNLTSVETFKILCDWLGTLLDTSLRFQQSQNNVPPSPQDHLMPLEYYKYFSKFLLQLSNRVSLESHTIYLGLSEKTSTNFEFKIRVKEVLMDIFHGVERGSVFIFEDSPMKMNLRYLILLPNTSLVEAQVISKKLDGILALGLGTQGNKKPFILSINSMESFELNKQQ